MRAKHASLQADGSLGSHRLELALRSDAAGMSGTVSGGYADGTWQGQLTGLAGNDLVGPWRLAAPASLTVSPRAVTVTPLVVTGLPAERAELTARLQLQPLQGTALAAWSGLDLSRANQWLGDTRIAGRSTGSLRLGLPGNDRLTLAGKASASGTVTTAQRTVTIQKALLDLDAGEWGTTATLEFRTAEGISVSGRFAAPVPATCSVPSKGELHASWQGLDPALAQTWLPRGVDLQGRLSGELAGRLLPEQRFDLNGTVTLADGKAGWRSEGRELTAAIQDAGLTWNWRGDSLSGALSMSLADSGEVRGNFRLPLPARTGAVPDRAGPVRGTFSGRFNEKGVLTSLFPGLLQETKGQLEADLRAGGTWQTPTLTGTAALTQAGAYLPAAGIRLADVRLNASLEGTQMKIESFRVKSGAGSLEGSADLSFAGNKLARYRGSLRGDGFQAVHLPELQLLVSPDLTFEGTPDSLTARGLIRVPEMLVNSPGSSAVVKPSRDTVVKGRTATASRDSGTALDLQFRLLLGEKVFVKSGGLDARLDGEVNLRMSGLSKATGSGEIKVARGNYTIYGVKLDIKRGRAIFSGGPVQRPALDILALREVDDVKAGVTVTGNPEAPVIKLYSEPTLPDTDILSYVVLGRKAREGGQQTALLMQAASLLASPGQTTSIQDKLKQLVRLDTLDYAPDKDRSPGYKPIETDLRANPQSKKDTTSVSQSVLLLGKFLTPELYVSYGRSLFTESQQFRARYSITKKWEVESKVSSDATGGDLYYRIEFD
jgi:translocation and assembly module TamB